MLYSIDSKIKITFFSLHPQASSQAIHSLSEGRAPPAQRHSPIPPSVPSPSYLRVAPNSLTPRCLSLSTSLSHSLITSPCQSLSLSTSQSLSPSPMRRMSPVPRTRANLCRSRPNHRRRCTSSKITKSTTLRLSKGKAMHRRALEATREDLRSLYS